MILNQLPGMLNFLISVYVVPEFYIIIYVLSCANQVTL